MEFTAENVPSIFRCGILQNLKIEPHASQDELECMKHLSFMMGNEYFNYVSAVNLDPYSRGFVLPSVGNPHLAAINHDRYDSVRVCVYVS